MAGSTVLIVEDDPVTRAHLAAAVHRQAGLVLAAAVGSCAEARQCLAGPAPGVLLADLGLPDGDGIELIRAAAARGTECMVVTVFGDERHVIAALAAGATGYLLKDSDLDSIGAAVLSLLGGGSPINPKIARFLVHHLRPATPSSQPAGESAVLLTERELEVLSSIAKGFSYAEIAQALAMSPHTVGTHVKHIYRKLAVSSRGEAVFEAAQLGLVDLNGERG